MNASPHSLLQGDVAPHLRRLSIPLVWGMLSMTLFSVVDTYFISRLGTKYLAALGFTIPLVMFYMGITFGLSVGTTSVLARVYGEGDMEKFKRLATDALSLCAIIVMTAAILGILTIDPVFRLMGATDDLIPLIHAYMAVWYCGMPFFGMMLIGNSCSRAAGDTKFVSSMMTLLSAINIILDPFLIFGWGPFPQLNLTGAAVTLVVAYYVTFAVSFYILIFRRGFFSPVIVHDGVFASWKRVMHIAVPSVISHQIAPVSAAIVTWMAATYGKEAVAALGVATRIEGMALLIFYAIAAGVSIFTGQNFGAGNYGRIAEAGKMGARYALYWGFLVAAVLWVFAGDIPRIFDGNADVASYTSMYLYWVPASFGALGVMFVTNAAMNAMGKPLQATMLILLRAIILYVPLAFFLQKYMGFFGIIAAMTATNMGVGALSYAWYRKTLP
jgi:putative MATE family efflux protein